MLTLLLIANTRFFIGVESFEISYDPDFAAKLEDIAGLYLDLSEYALRAARACL